LFWALNTTQSLSSGCVFNLYKLSLPPY